MPIELHVDPARPLDDSIPPDRIGKSRDYNVRAARFGELHRFVNVSHKIAGPLSAEGRRNRRLEPEQRNRPDGRLEQLRGRAARGWRHSNDDLFGALTSERREKTYGESVNVLWRHINVGRVVLRAHSQV